MKKLFALVLSFLLLCGSVTPALAAEDEPDNPELVAVRLVAVPLKNRVVFKNGKPNPPDGIKVELEYSNGSTEKVHIEKTEDGYCAGDYSVEDSGQIAEIHFGIRTTKFRVNDTFEISYRFLALPKLFAIN